MKKLTLPLILLPLLACTLASPTPTLTPTYTFTPPSTPSYSPTPPPTLPPPSQPGPLPFVTAAFTLGDAPRVCVGSALAVDPQTGYIYSSGLLDEQPCLTLIAPATGQVLETRTFSFEPRLLLEDSGTLYAVGNESGGSLAVLTADARTGEIVARDPIGGPLFGERVTLRDGWLYHGMSESQELHLTPLRESGEPVLLADALAFDLADDGRIATVGGSETTTVRVYASVGDALLAEREIGPGRPGQALAFDGQTNRIFITRQLPGGDVETGSLLDVLDAASLETIRSTEELLWQLTADPARGCVYGHAPEGLILAFDASTGQSLGTAFQTSAGEPEGFSVVSPWEKLSVAPATGRIHIVTSDFDGGNWLSTYDPTTDTSVRDVQVPSDVWALDGARNRLYFAGYSFLLALDAATLQPVQRLAPSRDPLSAAVAPAHDRLFVGDAGGDVHVLDLQTHVEVQSLPGVGGYVAVDPAHGWLYAGDAFAPGVSIYDLATLELRGVIPQPGRPTASPADGLVYILEEDVYVADGGTLEVLKGRTARNSGCNGCSFPTSVVVDPTSGITLTTSYGIWVGKAGPTSNVTLDPTTGRAFVAHTSGGYRIVNTLAAYADLTLERRLAWRDGLYGQLSYNPVTDHLYLIHSPRLLVLDGSTLDPIGWLRPSDEWMTPAAVDERTGRLYLLAGSQVLALEARGGQPETAPPQPVAHLPGPPTGIIPLPDGTLFVRAYDRESYVSGFYRSTDGGGTWEELHGGLPGAPNDLARALDGTLYAAAGSAGWRAETDEISTGEGVYRSTHGGDTWALASRGLAHLRVERVHARADGAVYALANGTWPDQQAWPVATIWRLGEDDRWTQVEIPDAGPYVVADGSLPYTYTQAVDTAWHALTGGGDLYRSWGADLQRSTDGGLTWETIGSGPATSGVQVLAGSGDPPAVYWLAWDALYRSTDLGEHWERLTHPLLAESGPTGLAVAERDGEETLFVGTEDGELIVLPAVEADWR